MRHDIALATSLPLIPPPRARRDNTWKCISVIISQINQYVHYFNKYDKIDFEE